MSAVDIILLDSSPEQPPSYTPARPAYDSEKLFGLFPSEPSPAPLPSPSELFRPPSRPRFFDADNESTKQSSAKGRKAPNGKTPVTEELESAGTEAITENKPKRRQAKATKKADLEDSTSDRNQKETMSKKPCRTEAKYAEGPKKRGRPSTKAAANNKTLSGRVAKAGNVQTKEPHENNKGPSTPKSPSGETSAKDLIDWEKEGLQLEAATKRRLDWTPTKDTMKAVVETDKVEGMGDSTSNSFGSLLADYNFSGNTSLPQSNFVPPEDGAITKRRRIELVDSRHNPESRQRSKEKEKPEEEEQSSKAPEPKKGRKKQPKKLTTLTARVTAQYNNDLTENQNPLAATVTQNKTTRSKGKVKPKPKEPEFIVLSPEAAAKTLDDQDLVFGTCSQLQREDSPTLLKETQAAIFESEKSMSAVSPFSLSQDSWSRPSSVTTMSRFEALRNLWSVAARDSEGSLAQIEIVDLSDSPAPPKRSFTSDDKTKVDSEKQSTEPNVSADVSSHNRVSKPKETSALDKQLSQGASQDSKTETSKSKEANLSPAGPSQMPRYAGFTDAELSKQVAAFGFKAVRARKKMIELLEKCWESRHATSMAVDRETRLGSTLSEATTELAPSQSQTAGQRIRKGPSTSQSTTSKAKTTTTKAKKAQSSKLSKSTKSKQEASTSPFMAKKATCQPIQSQTMPSTRSFADVEEIQDSEDETIPSPSQLLSRSSPHVTKKTRQSLPMSPTPSTPTRSTTRNLPQPSAASQAIKLNAPDLANQITKAVRLQGQARASSGPSKQLSWHEKMLLYDPIILEDFTGWLNTEGLALVAEDREVGAGFVRQWCENRSICCCYR